MKAEDAERAQAGSRETEDTAELFGLLPDPRAREELARMFQSLAEYLARRFYGRGEPLDDLVQVANLGLLKAIDRFDLSRGVKFSTYATATIVGELKRHFRDKGWALRVPRLPCPRGGPARSGRKERSPPRSCRQRRRDQCPAGFRRRA